MAAGHLVGAPRGIGLRRRIGLVERRLRVDRRADVGLLRHLLARAGEPDRLHVDADRLRRELRIDPGAILLVDVKHRRGRRRAPDLAALDRGEHAGADLLGGAVDRPLAVVRQERVEEHKGGDAIEDLLGRAGDRPAAVRMADEADVAQVFVFDHVDDVGDVGVEIDRAARQVRALAEPGERRREHGMALRAQKIGDTTPAPAAVPGAMHQHEGLVAAIAHARDGGDDGHGRDRAHGHADARARARDGAAAGAGAARAGPR